MTTRAFILSAAALLFLGCAQTETPAEKPEEAPEPAAKAPASEPENNEILLRDPDVAKELPDASLTGAGTRTVGGGDDLSPSGTVVARPPKRPASEPAPAEKKED